MEKPKIIPKAELKVGAYYEGICRNASVARWDGERFRYWREKFGMQLLSSLPHEEDQAGFDYFQPLKEWEIPLGNEQRVWEDG